MNKKFSLFGQQLGTGSGIGELMDDLGAALAEGDVCMLGGGQPAQIPEINTLWKSCLEEMIATDEGLQKALTTYDPPRGNDAFIRSLASLLHKQFGWDVSAENIAITAGGQTAFFLLFNALAGEFTGGVRKKILLPLVPEYIGYANQSVKSDLFCAVKPIIEKQGAHSFKYRIDFENLVIDETIAAICVSRPTNPSGNVLTDEEIEKLRMLARVHDIPLIVDNAYGAPFPNVIFTETTPVWDDSMILTLSLSKIGLPGTRTGIVIASKEIAQALSSMTAIVGLANGNIGQEIARPLIENGELLRVSNELVKPFYEKKSRCAQKWVNQYFDDDIPYQIHKNNAPSLL